MPVDGEVVLLGSTFQQITGKPDFVPCAFCAFREDLEFPLTSGDFGIDAFDIDAGLDTQVQMLFDQFTTEGVFRANRTIVRLARKTPSVVN